MGRKARTKKRGCSATNATKLYLVEHTGKLTVTKCKGKAKKKLTQCRRQMKRKGRGACTLHTLKAKKIHVKRGQGRIRRRGRK